MGWSTLSDLCIHDGKLVGGAYYQNYVGVWVADISVITWSLKLKSNLYMVSVLAYTWPLCFNISFLHWFYTLFYFCALTCQLIEPYGAGLTPERQSNLEQKQEHVECRLERVGSNRSSNSSLRCTSPDIDSKEIKNIYVDSKLFLHPPLKSKNRPWKLKRKLTTWH